MKKRRLLTSLILTLATVLAACGGDDSNEPAFAAPEFHASRSKVALGSPVEVTYKFVLPTNAPSLDRDYRVFVHFLDDNDELMWTDDHLPPSPTSEWKPGETIQYTRTIFIPIYPYIGQTSVRVGLYSEDGKRVKLAGDDRGLRSYHVATLELLPQSENVFLIYRDGWHQAEVAGDNVMVEWQWTKKEATIQFRNPKRDVLFYLHLAGGPVALDPPQVVDVFAGGQKVDSFSPAPGEETIRKIPISATLLGTGETCEIRLAVDRTFVPALLPAASSSDTRELGVRVFHAFVEVR